MTEEYREELVKVYPVPTLTLILLPAHGITHYPLTITLVRIAPYTFTSTRGSTPYLLTERALQHITAGYGTSGGEMPSATEPWLHQ